MLSIIAYDAEFNEGAIDGPIYELGRVQWKNPPAHIEYEPTDEDWGLFFGYAKVTDQPMQPGDVFNPQRFDSSISGNAMVTNVRLDPPENRYLNMHLNFVMLEQY